MKPVYPRRSALKKMASATAAALAWPLLSACSSSAPDALAFSDDLGGAQLEAILRGSFLSELDDIMVDLGAQWEQDRNATIELVLSQDWRSLTAQIARVGQGADIASLFGNEPHIMKDRLVDLSDLAETIGESHGGWSDDARATCVVDGVWRAVPMATTRHALVCRTDLIEEIGTGLPETYDDLLEIAVRLHEAGLPQVGFTMGELGSSDAAALAYGMLWSFGGREVGDNGAVALESEATVAAVSYFAELARVNADGAFGYSHPDNNNAYLAGDIAITQNPPSIYLAALENAPDVAEHTMNLPLPAGPAGQFQLPEIDSLAVFNHSQDVAAAMDWISFATQEEVLVERARKSLAFHAPVVPGLDDHPDMPWNTDEKLVGLSSTAAEGRAPGWPLPPSVEAGLVYDNFSIINMFRSAAEGVMTPAEAVRTAAEELRRVYET